MPGGAHHIETSLEFALGRLAAFGAGLVRFPCRRKVLGNGPQCLADFFLVHLADVQATCALKDLASLQVGSGCIAPKTSQEQLVAAPICFLSLGVDVTELAVETEGRALGPLYR